MSKCVLRGRKIGTFTGGGKIIVNYHEKFYPMRLAYVLFSLYLCIVVYLWGSGMVFFSLQSKRRYLILAIDYEAVFFFLFVRNQFVSLFGDAVCVVVGACLP